MRTIVEVAEDIKSILNNIERTEECTGETLVDISELVDEILTINYYKDKPKSNADRIRSMSDEELAEFLLKVNTAYSEPCMLSGGDCKWEDYPTHDKGCKDCFLEYLRKEAE